MKKIIFGLVLLLLVSVVLAPVLVTTSASQPYHKEITHEVLDGQFNDFYAKGVIHGTLIARYVGILNATHIIIMAKLTMLQKFNAYELVDGEAGQFYGTANMNHEYSGLMIVTVDEPVVMTMWTGTYSGTWVINFEEADIPEGSTYKGHVTEFYREGVAVKTIMKGVPPFPLP